MPHEASTDRALARTGARQRENGSRLLLAGGVLFALGLLFMLAFGDGNVGAYVGVALASLSTPPTVGGLALLLSGLVSGRAAQDKPFA